MRFLLTQGDKNRRIVILPVQIRSSLEAFRAKAEQTCTYESTKDHLGQERRSYYYTTGLESDEGEKFFSVEIAQRKCSGHYKWWDAYHGPKGVEVKVRYDRRCQFASLQALDDLMRELSLEEAGGAGSLSVNSFREVDAWYKKFYDETQKEMAGWIDEILKGQSLDKGKQKQEE